MSGLNHVRYWRRMPKPANVTPSSSFSATNLSQLIEAEDIDGAANISLMDCVECGCCSWVCPAHRPLVQHFRRGKAIVNAKRAAERAKQQEAAKK